MGWFSSKAECVYAFTSGLTIPLSEVKDEVFSQGLLGKGIAVKSKDGKFYSPVDGTVTMVFPTMHAIGMKSKGGSELILHIGIDTVKLEGKGFTAHVKDGCAVKKGDLLLEADLEMIEQEGYDTTAMLIVTDPMDSNLQYGKIAECQEKRMYYLRLNRADVRANKEENRC